MTPQIVEQLKSRMASEPRSLNELHRASHAAGSAWSEGQLHLLLDCLPDVLQDGDQFAVTGGTKGDPVTEALLNAVSDIAIPAAALVKRLPGGVVATAGALCEIARNHPDLELVPPNRIRRC